MQGIWVRVVAVVLLAMPVACGNTESSKPREPASAGSGGGMASGGAGGSGGSLSKVYVCRGGMACGTVNPREERLQVQGENGTFEDHCDDTGKLVQYGCACTILCSGPDCVPDSTVPYNTGEVSPTTLDCPCVDGACLPP